MRHLCSIQERIRKSGRLLALPLVPAAIALVLMALTLAAVQQPTSLTAKEKRGKQIYRHGTSATGSEITALVGATGVEVPAATLPCSNCHGMDGQGRPEGGVNPSDLRWSVLTKAYGVEHPGGRTHPPYTESALKRAISMGTDAGGNPLHVAMPHYRLSLADMVDLVAYIKRLESDPDPGLTAEAVQVAAVVPQGGPWDEVGASIEAALKAGIDQLNQRGGIYNRRIEMEVARVPMTPDERLAAIRTLLEGERYFALIAPFMAGVESDMADLIDRFEIPSIGPLTPKPDIDFPLKRSIFYIFPGALDQLRALIGFARQENGGRLDSAALIYSSAGGFDSVPDWRLPADYSREETLAGLSLEQFGPQAALAQVQDSQAETLFLATSGAEALEILRQADRAGFRPKVFVPGSLAGQGLFKAPAAFSQRIFVAAPSVPPATGSPATTAYEELARGYNLPRDHLSFQLSALAAVRLFAEGCTRAGRELSRDRLVRALEGLDAWDPTFSPRLTFGPNQRVGSLGVHIMSIDVDRQSYQSVRNWFEMGQTN